jgi:hypothetical protein
MLVLVLVLQWWRLRIRPDRRRRHVVVWRRVPIARAGAPGAGIVIPLRKIWVVDICEGLCAKKGGAFLSIYAYYLRRRLVGVCWALPVVFNGRLLMLLLLRWGRAVVLVVPV